MSGKELAEKCREQILLAGEDVKVGLAMRGKRGKRNHRTMMGVRGEIVSELSGGRLLVFFPAKELKEAIEQELKE